MQAVGLEWRKPLRQLSVILTKIGQWTWMMLVIMKKTFTNQDEEWQKQRQLRLFYRSMDYVIADENELCKVGRYICFADKMGRFVQFFHFFTSMESWTDWS